MRIVILALWGSLVLAPSASRAGDATPSYTNDDLDRIAPRRGETGVTSVPASRAMPATVETTRERAAGGAHGEAYWRQEADKLHDRLMPLRQRADALRLRIERASREKPTRPSGKAGGKPSGKPGAGRSQRPAPDTVGPLREQFAAVEKEIREREDRLEDRARREGALPGWLR